MLVDANHFISWRCLGFVRHVSAGAARPKRRGDAVDRSGHPNCEYRDRAPAGPCLWDERGNVLEVIGVTIDLSTQKQSDLQLQAQREELAHLSRIALIGEMTASLGHELNQPLTAIANNASAARRFLDRGQIEPATLKQLLGDIAAASHRAGEVINVIRGMARKGKSTRSLLTLNAVIADTLRLVHSDILIRETTVVTDFDS